MPTITIPENIGKVRVVMAGGGRYAVWNGKRGRAEFVVLCRNRQQANEVCGKINRREHDGEIVVTH